MTDHVQMTHCNPERSADPDQGINPDQEVNLSQQVNPNDETESESVDNRKPGPKRSKRIIGIKSAIKTSIPKNIPESEIPIKFHQTNLTQTVENAQRNLNSESFESFAFETNIEMGENDTEMDFDNHTNTNFEGTEKNDRETDKDETHREEQSGEDTEMERGSLRDNSRIKVGSDLIKSGLNRIKLDSVRIKPGSDRIKQDSIQIKPDSIQINVDPKDFDFIEEADHERYTCWFCKNVFKDVESLNQVLTSQLFFI
jgi:hypothetical protein